jgi:protein-tyrosine-phosphatase
LTLGLPVEISTAGTLESEDAPALPEAIRIAGLCGVDLSSHRSRPLSAQSLEATDLVIGFEQAQVRRAVIDAGAAPGKSFTFREIVGLVDESHSVEGMGIAEQARSAVRLAAELRDLGPASAGELDVPDPFRRSWKVQRAVAVETRALSLALAQRLFGASEGLPPIPARIRKGSDFRFFRRLRPEPSSR